MNQELTKYDALLAQLENLRFYIRTEEQASKALLFSKRLKKFANLVEEKVKTRASELMSDLDKHTIEFDGWIIKRVEPTEQISYKAAWLIDAIGLDRAMPFLTVSTKDLKYYIIKQGVNSYELDVINKGRTSKPKRGYIKIIENKKDEQL